METNRNDTFKVKHLFKEIIEQTTSYPLQLLWLMFVLAIGNTLLSFLSVDGASWRNVLSGICGSLLDVSVAIALFVLLNHHMNEIQNSELTTLDVIRKKLVKCILTNIIVALIITLSLIVMTFIVATLFSFVMAEYRFAIGFIPVLGASIYFYVKYAMILQMVVYKDLYYMDALNKSKEYVNKHLKMVVGIQILPIFMNFVPTYIVPKIPLLSTSFGKVCTNLLSGIIFILSLMALTILFFYIDRQEDKEKPSDEKLELSEY